MNNAALLGQEWTTLQNNFEQYELWCLVLKVAALALVLVAVVLHVSALRLGGLLVLLWLQEAILRTFQARLGQRLLQVEALVRALSVPEPSVPVAPMVPVPAFQLHSAWQSTRPGGLGLLAEYARSACRPTVAFPYAVLLAVGLVLAFRAAM